MLSLFSLVNSSESEQGVPKVNGEFRKSEQGIRRGLGEIPRALTRVVATAFTGITYRTLSALSEGSKGSCRELSEGAPPSSEKVSSVFLSPYVCKQHRS